MTNKLCKTYLSDPHFFKDGDANKPNSIYGQIVSPVHLGAGWMTTAFKLMSENGQVLVNSAGGMIPYGQVVSEIKSETLTWPVAFPDEKITITRWPQGDHFYLTSSEGRIFDPIKYNTFDEALKAAKRIVPEDRIKTVGVSMPKVKREGD